MHSSRFLGLIIVIILLIGGAFAFLHRSKNNPVITPASQNQTSSTASSNTSLAPAGGNIRMTNMLFTPPQISVAKGASVTWTNDDKVTHTVVDDLNNVGGPSSGNIEPGATYTFTFEKSGSFQYHCSIHSSMRGTIVVK